MRQASIPLVSFEDFRRSGAPREAFVEELGQGLEQFGFAFVADHGVDEGLIDEAYTLARRVFSLPEPVKRAYETPEDGRKRGYTSIGVEHAKDSSIPDLKEFWHLGRALPDGSEFRARGGLAANRYPMELPEFAPVFEALFEAIEAFATALLGAVGEYLGYPAGFFEDMVRDGDSVLRIVHYPPLGPEATPGAVRAAQHEDINLLTILPVSTAPGLELRTRAGEWLEVVPPPGVMVCDTGDMMALLTGDRLPATTHRVVNPRGVAAHRSRYALPFFCHPRPDVRLAGPHARGAGVSAGAFLMQRLREIGVAPEPPLGRHAGHRQGASDLR